VWNALQNGDADVPFIQVELTEAEEAQALLSLDAIAALAETDREQVNALLEQVNTDNANVMKFLTDFAKESGLEWGQPEQGDAEPQIDRAAELLEKWQVKTGDLWQIGERRLLCGDSTKREDVERVMGGENEYSVLTDPPYNIGFVYESINDKMETEEYKEFCEKYYSIISPDAIGVIITPGPKNERLYPEPRDKGIWFKPYAMAGASCFHTRHCEPILFYGKFTAKRNSDFFDYSSQFPEELHDAERRAGVTDKHAPAKSMPLWEELINMTSGIILDVFGGTGTTMIVSQRMNRISRLIEISPAYCSVILERMSVAFPEIEIHRD
jgi:hypothetical protein